MSRHLIVDLSNNNPHADLGRVKRAGIDGLWHKVSEGGSFVDQRWPERRNVGRRVGLRVGGYHFARFTSEHDAVAEARHFVKHLGPIGRRDLAPALDLETSEGLHGRELVACARAFNHEVKHLTGVWPIFYSFPAFIVAMGAARTIGRGLWLASFSLNDGREHPYVVPAPFRKALAHQFTSEARVPGVSGRCDLSSAARLVPILAHGWRGL